MALIAVLITTAGCDPSVSVDMKIVDLEQDCGDLSIGDSGNCVKELQRLLNERGATLPREGERDYGRFGPETLSGVRQFQHVSGLNVVGVVGSQTKDALYDKPLWDTDDWNLRTECIDLDYGAIGPCVASLQRLLNQYGAQLPDGDPTYGPRTTEAVRQFQRNHGLIPNGVVRSETKKALYNGLPPKAPLNPETEVHDCPGPECSVYLSRTTTADIATAFDNPIFDDLITAFITEIACYRLRNVVHRVTCSVVVLRLIDVLGVFRQARDDHECVRISFDPTSDGYKPVNVSKTNEEYCQN